MKALTFLLVAFLSITTYAKSYTVVEYEVGLSGACDSGACHTRGFGDYLVDRLDNGLQKILCNGIVMDDKTGETSRAIYQSRKNDYAINVCRYVDKSFVVFLDDLGQTSVKAPNGEIASMKVANVTKYGVVSSFCQFRTRRPDLDLDDQASLNNCTIYKSGWGRLKIKYHIQ